ncbi:MAG: hypothetical protein ACRDZY_08685, partial [Acidimicrobiales bacterium]
TKTKSITPFLCNPLGSGVTRDTRPFVEINIPLLNNVAFVVPVTGERNLNVAGGSWSRKIRIDVESSARNLCEPWRLIHKPHGL